jgi:UDP-N-acetylmuramyl pentapeptide synthase
MFERRRLRQKQLADLEALRQRFVVAAAPLVGRCFADHASDVLLADERALAELGSRAAELRTALDAHARWLQEGSAVWDRRAWPHEDKKSTARRFVCWDRGYVESEARLWLAQNTPVRLPLAVPANADPTAGLLVGGVRGGLVAMAAALAISLASSAKAKRATRKLTALSAHRTYTPTNEMRVLEDEYNERLAAFRPAPAAKAPRPPSQPTNAPPPADTAAERAEAARKALRSGF